MAGDRARERREAVLCQLRARPVNEIKIAPDAIEAGLEWLFAYNPENTDGREIVRNIMAIALASFVLS